MPEERPVKAVRLLGEDLVLFKRGERDWGLVGRYCAHRGVDLAYGRLEDGGLRCLYHGWLYGKDGRCLEQPAEPPHSRFFEKVRIASYPCEERNGIVFAYMGGGDPPPFPDYDCFQRAGGVHLRLQGPLGVQLAAGGRGRDRPQPRLLPAPLPRRGSARGLRPAVPRGGRGDRTLDRRDRRRTVPAGHRGRAGRARPARLRGARAERGDAAPAGHQPGLPQRLRRPVRRRRRCSASGTSRSTTRTTTGT